MIVRRLARPLLASIFIYGGINALRQAEGHAEAAKPLVDKAADQVQTDPATPVRVDAAVKVVAGTAFAFGKLPRLSALALIGSLVPTTAADTGGRPSLGWRARRAAKEAREKLPG